jgi:hypothetical protein
MKTKFFLLVLFSVAIFNFAVTQKVTDYSKITKPNNFYMS